jgi:methylphosphotriester-DNA--protein-cysteine methyltransferase
MNNRRFYYKVLAPFASLMVAGATQAAEVDTSIIDQALNLIEQQNEAAVASQENVTRLSNSASTLFEEFKLENDNLEAMLVLNAGLRKQISVQEENIATLQQSITDVAVVTQEMPLLMTKMLASIEQFVELDLPFQQEERRARLQFARDAIDSPDVSVAEKFRQILVLYQTENNYGRTHETYATTLNLEGVDRDVDILRVGRIALLYQTKDRTMTGAWDKAAGAWVTLDPVEYRTAVQRAISVSSGLVSPSILEIPIVAPESAQ